MNVEQVVHQAAALRGQGRFQDAIDLVEANLPADKDEQVPALAQALYAAKEGKLNEKASEIAAKIRAIEPDLPSIQGL